MQVLAHHELDIVGGFLRIPALDGLRDNRDNFRREFLHRVARGLIHEGIGLGQEFGVLEQTVRQLLHLRRNLLAQERLWVIELVNERGGHRAPHGRRCLLGLIGGEHLLLDALDAPAHVLVPLQIRGQLGQVAANGQTGLVVAIAAHLIGEFHELGIDLLPHHLAGKARRPSWHAFVDGGDHGGLHAQNLAVRPLNEVVFQRTSLAVSNIALQQPTQRRAPLGLGQAVHDLGADELLCLSWVEILHHAGGTLANPRGDLLRLAGLHTLARQP